MGTDNGKAIDPGKCPLCGQGNACASAANEPPGACWCAGEKFPPGLFDLLPPGTRNKACICQACLKAYAARRI
ncbi:cysteine-rich CWC family protein [Cohnella cellulosilytica]|uniref:Cysteine-rich CWC family protein n=2 Tax=Cohnella cellulosilytica TaxID=986710 RepID=A0ABW2FG88_9BACL